jgi:GNAT superfamily N-acetyltransferase
LDLLLAERGYRIDGVSEVWCAAVVEVESAALPFGQMVHSDEPSAAWLDVAFDEPAARRRVHEEIVRSVPSPRAFISAVVDGVVAACALAVGGAGQTGLFCMTTRETFRRQGVGGALVGAVGAWAAELGDERVYLQVMRDNEAAKGLYRKAGFTQAYDYHYRVL